MNAGATTSVLIDPSILTCGGVQISDAGCSVTCGDSGDATASAHASECHQLSDFSLLCNNPGVQCIVGKDSAKYVVNHSSCFCD